ncbi:hypothetical protein [Methylorubrum extorquens]|uniref:hypothetical protein n=1 Tax=Methylorubrum extorquens TaxID=408 RepID=UPI0020A0FD1B|nr:hypothetical protein [Methylorubrum extorquens]MCP1540065.1 hypothetical protein [Methylorubrum extorquens]
MPRIKITQPGWDGFTGEIGTTLFEGGISVESVNARHIAIIGASLSLVTVDEIGEETGVNPALQHQMLTNGTMSMAAPMLVELARATDAPAPAAPAKADTSEIVFHTKEDLEKIAEARGIIGLRAVMEPLGLKATSINKAIQVILKEELKRKAQLEASGALVREDATKTDAPDEVVETDETGTGSEPAETDEQKAAREALEAENAAKQAEAEAEAEKARLAVEAEKANATPPADRDPQNSDAGPGADSEA